MDSVWSESVDMVKFPRLQENIKTDVLIVGGGMAGVLCAYFLQKKGINYVLAEGKTIGSGVSKSTTAKITSQHGLIYHKLVKNMGMEKASLYLKANQDALREYEKMCKNIECNFEQKPSYVYSLLYPEKLEKEIKVLEKMGFPVEFRETAQLPFKTQGAVCFENQAQFHPLKFMNRIAGGLNIYEHTFIKEWKDNVAITEEGNISFEKIIFTTHFPIDNKHGLYFMKMYQHRSYVIAVKNAVDVKGMYVDEDEKGMSFRNFEDMLFIGGGSHRTGKKGGNWKEIRKFADKYYPEAKEVSHWATQDCMSLDGIPYIGQYSKGKNNYYVATGFNKWGMTSSMMAAGILADLIMEKENPYLQIFHPSRGMIKPQLFVNMGESVMNLLTFSKRRCPHLGCALKWNEAEKSWDCTCHGSRFDEDGGLIDNPATGNLKL